MNTLVRPPRISSTILDRVGYFMPRLLFANARIAPQLHWGDITRALDGFESGLVDPASAAFWDEWRRRFSAVGDSYKTLAASSPCAAGRVSALRSAAAAYHFAEFMFFEDTAIKTGLRKSVRRCFTATMTNSPTRCESWVVKAGGHEVPVFLFLPHEISQSADLPCVILSNGLDSMRAMPKSW